MTRALAKKMIGFASKDDRFPAVRRLLKWAVTGSTKAMGGASIYYEAPGDSRVIALIRQIMAETDLLLEVNESYQLFMVTKNTMKIEGDIAEVGSYTGGSAKLICEAKGVKHLHLFDTFEGLPELGEYDKQEQFQKGQYCAQLDEVRRYLSGYENVHIYKGLFPSTTASIENRRFSLVHLDVDLYEATRAGIEFFYPRLNTGGIIISHDYSYAPGVKRAFDEYFDSKPEPIIEMSGTQCLIVKS